MRHESFRHGIRARILSSRCDPQYRMAASPHSAIRSESPELRHDDSLASKRKYEAETSSDQKIPKKKRRRRKKDTVEFAEVDNGINLAISKMNKCLLADHIARKTKRFAPDLSSIELEDRRIAGGCGCCS